MNRDVCEHSTPVDLPCDKCHVANRGGHIAVAMSRIADLEAQRDALLKTMKWLDRWMGAKPMTECSEKVRAAIKAVEGEKR